MGLLSRALKDRKKAMLQELETEQILAERHSQDIKTVVAMPSELAITLHEMATMRGIDVEQLVITRLQAIANAYQFSKVLRLKDSMPYGQYKGVLVEDMIRADPRYVNYMASNSSIFVLDEEATELLKRLS